LEQSSNEHRTFDRYEGAHVARAVAEAELRGLRVEGCASRSGASMGAEAIRDIATTRTEKRLQKETCGYEPMTAIAETCSTGYK
jgi:hypothetical protein